MVYAQDQLENETNKTFGDFNIQTYNLTLSGVNNKIDIASL